MLIKSTLYGYGLIIEQIKKSLDFDKIKSNDNSKHYFLPMEEVTLEDIDDLEYRHLINDPRRLITTSVSGCELGRCLYIGNTAPFEKSPFISKSECDDYLYNALTPILKDSVTRRELGLMMDEVEDLYYIEQ